MNRLLTCREATRLISRRMDSALPMTSTLLLRVHLLVCDACRRFTRQAAQLREALRHYRGS